MLTVVLGEYFSLQGCVIPLELESELAMSRFRLITVTMAQYWPSARSRFRCTTTAKSAPVAKRGITNCAATLPDSSTSL